LAFCGGAHAVNLASDKLVTLGVVLGAWGVKGWVRIRSFTEPRENIIGFADWIVRRGAEQRSTRIETGKTHGRAVVVKLEGIDDRAAAEQLAGWEILVTRTAMAPCEPGEYYWADLEGKRVLTTHGDELGRVVHLLETGSNDVMVVAGERERLIPFIKDTVVRTVDLAEGVIVVDWDPAF
jgi:16S rRNA processing protein RimM